LQERQEEADRRIARRERLRIRRERRRESQEASVYDTLPSDVEPSA
jgi:hypothetical protein